MLSAVVLSLFNYRNQRESTVNKKLHLTEADQTFLDGLYNKWMSGERSPVKSPTWIREIMDYTIRNMKSDVYVSGVAGRNPVKSTDIPTYNTPGELRPAVECHESRRDGAGLTGPEKPSGGRTDPSEGSQVGVYSSEEKAVSELPVPSGREQGVPVLQPSVVEESGDGVEAPPIVVKPDLARFDVV